MPVSTPNGSMHELLRPHRVKPKADRPINAPRLLVASFIRAWFKASPSRRAILMASTATRRV